MFHDGIPVLDTSYAAGDWPATITHDLQSLLRLAPFNYLQFSVQDLDPASHIENMKYLLDKSISQFQHLHAENCIVKISEPFSDFARRLVNEVQISKNGLNVFDFAAKCQEFHDETNILQEIRLNPKALLLSPSHWIEMLESAELFRRGFPVGCLREAKSYGLEWVKLIRQYLDKAEIEVKNGWDLTSSVY